MLRCDNEDNCDTATFIQDLALGTEVTDILSTCKDETFLCYVVIRQFIYLYIYILMYFHRPIVLGH